ncbi:MAG: riboflavin biosynthesis protein RibF [Alphaproteobacteria bacterium]
MIRLINSLVDFPHDLRGGVLAIGNFDGVHLGHCHVLGMAAKTAELAGVSALAVSFNPHPRRFFKPEEPPFNLSGLEEKTALMQKMVAAHLVLPFTHEFASQSAEDFIVSLKKHTDFSHLVVGEDFCFGKNRSGDATILGQISTRLNFGLTLAPPLHDTGGEIISSSRIRKFLRAGNPIEASHLLGRPWCVQGITEQGDGRGQQLGFPTANFAAGDLLSPAYGVYAVTCQLEGYDGLLQGAAHFGVRPQWHRPTPLWEVHLFGEFPSLYQRNITLYLQHYLRAECRFDGVEALIAQMHADCALTKKLLQ